MKPETTPTSLLPPHNSTRSSTYFCHNFEGDVSVLTTYCVVNVTHAPYSANKVYQFETCGFTEREFRRGVHSRFIYGKLALRKFLIETNLRIKQVALCKGKIVDDHYVGLLDGAQNAVQQRLGSWGATGNVYVNRHNTINAAA